jgi:hypothetical protein
MRGNTGRTMPVDTSPVLARDALSRAPTLFASDPDPPKA